MYEVVKTVAGFAVIALVVLGVHVVGNAGCDSGWDAANGRACVSGFWSSHDLPDGLPSDGTWTPGYDGTP